MVGPTGMIGADGYLPASETEPLMSHGGTRALHHLYLLESHTLSQRTPLSHIHTLTHTFAHIQIHRHTHTHAEIKFKLFRKLEFLISDLLVNSYIILHSQLHLHLRFMCILMTLQNLNYQFWRWLSIPG